MITICSSCILDDSDINISFDKEGVCNHCREWSPRLASLPKTDEEAEKNLADLRNKIINGSHGSGFNCIIGLSGGVDSSYICYLALKLGLKPLIVHFDNGWNSELAVKNIERIISKTGFDLKTLVVDWDEFRDLQLSYLKASVVDIEVATDHAIIATMYKYAQKYKIKYILSGGNIATETGMPKDWTWSKKDLKNLKSIHKKYGKLKLRTYPTRSLIEDILEKRLFKNIHDIRILDKVNYSKSKAIETLQTEFGWEYYGGKHHESTFTKFYQSYILPTKFGIDKRKVHLSSLIRNGEITRENAIENMNEDLYSNNQLKIEKQFVLKKLGLSKEQFQSIMDMKPVPHETFQSDYTLYRKLRAIYHFVLKK